MDIDKILRISMIFLLGFLSANFIGYCFVYGLEVPFAEDLGLDFLNISNENSAPSDFIKENQISVYKDKIIIYIKDASLSKYAPTGSMKPILDSGSNGIRIIPENSEIIKIGDIITFEKNNLLIIHRVVDKGYDEQGVYFITKGDNNTIKDGKIRFKDIRYKTIGILW